MNEMMTDCQEREIWYSLIIAKEGIRDKYFDELVKNLTEKLKQLKLPAWSELQGYINSVYSSKIPDKATLPKDEPVQRLLNSLIGLYKPENLIYNFGDSTVFEYPVCRSWIPKDKGPQYDKIKKDMQSLIKQEDKYKTYSLSNTWNYTLTEEEAKEFDILKVLSGLVQQLQGIQENFNPKALSQDLIEGLRKLTIERLPHEVFLILKNITFKTPILNDSFYFKIEHILDYLYSKGLARKPNMPDIKERYLKAVEDCNKASWIPHTFIFFVDCWPREIEKFLLLKEELLKELRETDYQIRLDSNPNHSDGYGCFCIE